MPSGEPKSNPKNAGRLRIIAGTWRGRMIAAPDDEAVRPTAARAREALFNRLAHSFVDEGFRLAGARVVDVCAGSGLLGLEALSRGAVQATFVDQAPAALALLRRNIATLAAEDRAHVLSANAQNMPRAPQACDVAFLDPPYGKGLVTPILTTLAAQGWLRAGAIVSVETETGEDFGLPEGYVLADRRAYGRTGVTLLKYL